MTRLMVLGLLRMKPMSGYEIQQLLQTSQTDKWAGILPGSIYHALKKMEKEGLVEIESVETTGHRSKAIYKVTEKGVDEYDQLLIDSFKQSSVVLPTVFYTGLSMLSMPNNRVNVNELMNAVEEQKRILQQERQALETGMHTKARHMKAGKLTELTFTNILGQYDLQLRFLDEVIEELQFMKNDTH
ncbi:PadR family transcriptional regulator [Bacillus songklensis]|uniref:PadR family transcriptional regulator n=1 Tax=Bacillus songklensis TaxID=1069116 RepID=A0ABV8B6R1_9BACI